jgi:hypothetical protein
MTDKNSANEVLTAGPPHDRSKVRLAPSERDLGERVRRAVTDAAERDADSMKRLRVAVASFTIALRDIGTTPEQVLIALKTAINNRSFVPISPHVSDWTGEGLREKISTWCIEEFFNNRGD